MRKILLIDTVHESLQEMLSKHGFVCDDGSHLSREEVLNRIDNYVGVVIRSRFKIDRVFLEHCHNLKFIARAGAGMENIDVDFAQSKNIVCINSPEGNRDAVAEHALAMLLSLFNKIKIADSQVRNGVWLREENRGTELQHKTVGIIGFGNMGAAFAKRLQGFDVNVLVYDKYIFVHQTFPFVRQVEMNELYAEADIISLHVPLTNETAYLADETFFHSFSKDIYIINTSRGKVLKTAALVEAMKTGKVKGACLDVSEYENISFEELQAEQLPSDWQYLVKNDNVLLTPHIAGWSFESHRKISEVLAEKIVAVF